LRHGGHANFEKSTKLHSPQKNREQIR